MLMTMLEKQMMVMKMVTQLISTRQNPTVTTLITTDKARHGRNICGGNICGGSICGGNIYGGNMLLSHDMMVMMTITKQAATVTP